MFRRNRGRRGGSSATAIDRTNSNHSNDKNNKLNARTRRRGRNMRRGNMMMSSAESRASISQHQTNVSNVMVGTEALAAQNMERNAKEFRYPLAGFVTPIEHSLVYNMIREPKIYPREVIIQHILDEDFSYYLEIREPNSTGSPASTNNGYRDNANGTGYRDNSNSTGYRENDVIINRTASYESRNSHNSLLEQPNQPNHSMHRSGSYAGSYGSNSSSGNEAITTATNDDVDDDEDDDDDDDDVDDGNNDTTNPGNGPIRKPYVMDESEQFHRQRRIILQPSKVSYAQLSAILALSAEYYPPTPIHNVSEVLGKTIIKCVIKYCNEHELDRSVEIQELLTPVEEYAIKRSANAELKAVVPLYAGYTASLLTANPIPVIVGFTMWNQKRIETERELRNLQAIKNETARRSNVETSGLLDEMDDEY